MSRSTFAETKTGGRRSGADDGSRSFPLVCGALAGFVATAPMTATMERLHRKLSDEDRYPLPPREITSSILPELPNAAARDTSLVAHFAYGGLCGLLLAALKRRPSLSFGVAGGLGIWLGSYFGWIPGLNVLKPPSEHPAPRTATMVA